jgi:uncharacterized protein
MTESGSPELSATSQSPAHASSAVRPRIPTFVVVIQSILLLIHLFLYVTWVFFWGTRSDGGAHELQGAIAFLSISFVAATLLAHSYFNPLLRAFYSAAAVWLGFVNFFFMAACACWILYGVPLVFGVRLEKHALAEVCFGLAVAAGTAAVVNAAWTRVIRVPVQLPNLPASWRGRTAAVVSDLHLGHLNHAAFLRRIVRKLSQLRPDALFIPGDLFDGTAVDTGPLTKIWTEFSAPLGSYFITGNHEEFSSASQYLDAVRQSGIRVIENEKIVVDGLQIVGVRDRASANVENFRAILRRANLDPNAASILLVHNPNHLPVAAEAGISLQLSGHTHRGQFFPFTKIVSRIYGKYAHGLHRFADMQVYTSCGAGTWGPPMRLGSNPEIVLLAFE